MGAREWWELLLMVLLRGGLYALMAVGLSLALGVANVSNFGHGEFYMLGAYCAYFAWMACGGGLVGAVAGVVAATVAGAVAGALLEVGLLRPMRRRSGGSWVMNTFLLTLGVSIIMQNTAKLLVGTLYCGVPELWPGRVSLATLNVATDRIVACVLALGSVLALWAFLQYARMGRAIRAVSQNETAATLLGIDRKRVYLLSLAIGSALAALAGGSLISITPAYPTMGMAPLYKSWFVLVLIGMGTVSGCVLGGFLVALLETVSYYFLGAGWQDAISLAMIILVLLWKPSGIFAKPVRTIWEQ